MIRRIPAAVRAMANIWRSVCQRTEFAAGQAYRPDRMALPNRMELSMRRTVIVSAVMAVFLSTGGSAFAQGQGNGDRNDRGHDQQMQPRGEQNADRYDHGRNDQMQGRRQPDRHETQARQPDRRDYQRGAQNDHRYEGRGAGPNHAFYRGERLPVQYRHRQYVVDDWRGHRLSAPPRGYHWVQTGADYVLVAIATGVILQLLLAN
jgi:Ni/Co efflux regulator RcnB